jgi:hypothetical protein
MTLKRRLQKFFALDGTSRILLVLAAIVDRIRDRAHPLHMLLFGGITMPFASSSHTPQPAGLLEYSLGGSII